MFYRYIHRDYSDHCLPSYLFVLFDLILSFFLGLNLECKSAFRGEACAKCIEIESSIHLVQWDNFKVLGYSISTWTKFYPSLTQMGNCGHFRYYLPLLVHVVIECPLLGMLS